MRALILIILAGLILCPNPFVINNQEVNQLKVKAKWEVQPLSENRFKAWTVKQVKKLMGFKPSKSDPEVEQNSNQIMKIIDNSASTTLPTSFDGRIAWQKCIAPVKNQGECGSCWAHAAGDTLSVIRCLKLNLDNFEQLSIQDMVSCDRQDKGCDGGLFNYAFSYLTMFGVVSDNCFPYTSGEEGKVPKCPRTCNNSQELFIKHKCLKRSVVNYGKKIKSIKKWLVNDGPLTVGFMVYSDFMSYKSGIYTHVSGEELGGHAVTLVGYGSDPNNGTPYWICQNSWTANWGINGYFYIKMGECIIDNEAYSCLPSN